MPRRTGCGQAAMAYVSLITSSLSVPEVTIGNHRSIASTFVLLLDLVGDRSRILGCEQCVVIALPPICGIASQRSAFSVQLISCK